MVKVHGDDDYDGNYFYYDYIVQNYTKSIA